MLEHNYTAYNHIATIVKTAIDEGLIQHCEATYDVSALSSCITLEVIIPDRLLVKDVEMEEEEEIRAVERPSTHSITVEGVANLKVRWDKERGLFSLESVCPSCARKFERTLRGFVTKHLITLAHELGFQLGEHLERHRTFEEYLRTLQKDVIIDSKKGG